MLTADLHDFVRIRRDDDVVQQWRGSNTFVNAAKQRLPGYLAEHFAGQPRRGKARWDDRNRFHATSVNFSPDELQAKSSRSDCISLDFVEYLSRSAG
jgi:hypothetical protein